jgi:hypothetical protein
MDKKFDNPEMFTIRLRQKFETIPVNGPAAWKVVAATRLHKVSKGMP